MAAGITSPVVAAISVVIPLPAIEPRGGAIPICCPILRAVGICSFLPAIVKILLTTSGPKKSNIPSALRLNPAANSVSVGTPGIESKALSTCARTLLSLAIFSITSGVSITKPSGSAVLCVGAVAGGVSSSTKPSGSVAIKFLPTHR